MNRIFFSLFQIDDFVADYKMRGDDFPIAKYWGKLKLVSTDFLKEQEDMILLLSEVIGKDDT